MGPSGKAPSRHHGERPFYCENSVVITIIHLGATCYLRASYKILDCEKSQKRDEFKSVLHGRYILGCGRAGHVVRPPSCSCIRVPIPPRKGRRDAISVTKKGRTLTAKTNKNSFGFASGRRKSDTTKCLIIRLLHPVARASGHKKGTAGAVSLPSDLNRFTHSCGHKYGTRRASEQ